MTLYLGIDESIVTLKKYQNAFIYVGTFSKYDSQGEINQTKSKKIRTKTEFPLNCFNGLAGFLFGIFLFDQKKPNTNEQQFESVYTLIDEGIQGAQEVNILDEYEDIAIEIDGHDNYRIGSSLNYSLSNLYENRIHLQFIPHGDEKVKIIHSADMIAYALRGLKDIGSIDKNLYEKGIDVLLKDNDPKIKKITPLHLGFKSRESIENKVA